MAPSMPTAEQERVAPLVKTEHPNQWEESSVEEFVKFISGDSTSPVYTCCKDSNAMAVTMQDEQGLAAAVIGFFGGIRNQMVFTM